MVPAFCSKIGNGTAGTVLQQPKLDREGANREKLTVKKIINNEMFFFTVYVPYKT